MATKTITVDVEAYDLLARRKRPGQSFSEVIKEHFGPPKTAAALLEWLQENAHKFSPEFFEAVEEQIRNRSLSTPEVPEL